MYIELQTMPIGHDTKETVGCMPLKIKEYKGYNKVDFKVARFL